MGNPGLFASRGGTWTYVLATPDAVLGGALPFVLDRVKAHGLRPSYCCLIELEVDKMQQFYGGQTFVINNPGSPDYHFSWSTHRQLYAIAPACLIMLSREHGSACETMLRCKGHVRPELAAPTTIRSRGENVVFNLVHCPDDNASALRELTILFGAKETERLLGMCDVWPDDTGLAALADSAALADALPVFSGSSATSFPAIARRIRCRIVMKLVTAVHSDGQSLRDLLQAREALTHQRRVFEGCSTTEERMRCAQEANVIVHEALARPVARHGNPALIATVEALSELHELRGRRRVETVTSSSEHGIYISPLERVILESHGHAFQLNKEIEGIYA